jgi:hypothetical protein
MKIAAKIKSLVFTEVKPGSFNLSLLKRGSSGMRISMRKFGAEV